MNKVSRSIGKMPYRRRSDGLSAIERNQMHKLLDSAINLMNIIGNLPAAARAITMVLVTALLTRVALMRTTFWAPLPDIDTTNYNRGLDSFEKDKCWNFFRFRKVDLPRLIVLLQIPPFLILKGDKNGQVSGAFAFLILCYRLLYDTRELYQTDNLEEFGCDYSKLDKIFNCRLDYLYFLYN